MSHGSGVPDQSQNNTLTVDLTAICTFVVTSGALFWMVYRYRYYKRNEQETLSLQALRDQNRPNGILSCDSLEHLPIQIYAEPGAESVDMSNYDTCAICLDTYVVGGSEVRMLPCSHIFHATCVDPWLTEKSGSCPNCKATCHIKAKDESQETVAAAETPPASNISPLSNHP